MATNPWEELSLEDVVDLGKHALNTGLITHEQAAKNYSAVHPVLKHLGIGNDPVLNPTMKVKAQRSPAAQQATQQQNQASIARIRKEVEAENTGTVNVPTQNPAVYQKVEVPGQQQMSPLAMPYVAPVAEKSGLSNSMKVGQMTANKNESESGLTEMEKERVRQDALNKISSQLVQYEPLPEWTERVQGIKSSPVFQEQMSGIRNMQDLAALEAQAPVDIYSGPIAGLLQSEFGRNVSAMNANKGTTPSDVRNRLLGYNDKIQDDLRDLNAKVLEAAKGQKIGTTTDIVSNRLVQDQAQEAIKKFIERQAQQEQQTREAQAKAADPFSREAGGNRAELQQSRLDFMAHQRNIQALKKDKPLNDKINQYQNLANALNNLSNAHTLTPQQIDEAQQTIRANLGIKGTSGIGEREKTFINSLGLTSERWSQFLSGDLSNIPKDSPIIRHIEDLAKLESDNVAKQVGTRMRAVTGGNDSVYKRNPELFDDLTGLRGSYMGQVSSKGVNATHKKEEMIKVVSPSGKKGSVPKSKLDAALKAGYKKE